MSELVFSFSLMLDQSADSSLVKMSLEDLETTSGKMLREGYTEAEIDKMKDKARPIARQKITDRGGKALGPFKIESKKPKNS